MIFLEAVLENPALFHGGYDLNGIKLSQIDIAVEYIQYCKLYPEPTLRKKIRGHMMKYLYRYFLVHFEERDRTGAAQTLEEYEDIIDVSKTDGFMCLD